MKLHRNTKFAYILYTVILILATCVFVVIHKSEYSNTQDDISSLEQVENQDKEIKCKVLINNKYYDLSELAKDIVSDVVVVDVTLDNSVTKQGYISFSDKINKPEVEVFENCNFVQIRIPIK